MPAEVAEVGGAGTVRRILATVVALALAACTAPAPGAGDGSGAGDDPPVGSDVEVVAPDRGGPADLGGDPGGPGQATADDAAGAEVVPARAEPPPPPPTRPALEAAARALVVETLAEVGDATVGVLVVDEHGREVVAHEPDVPVLPASTVKVVTAAAALVTLGAEARLRTRVEVTAPVGGDGVVHGDLVLVGGGDPVLVTDEYVRWVYPARPRTRLSELADAVVAAGVRRVDGDVVGVSDGFPGARVADGWPDRYFADLDARFSDGLTVDAGLRTLVTHPEPEEDDPETATETATEAGAEADPTVPPQQEEASEEEPGPPEVRVDHAPDPQVHAASELLRLLEERGVEVRGGPRRGRPSGPVVGRIAEVASPPLHELLRFAVQRSDNQVSDQLFRVVARARTGAGSWYRGDRAVRQVLDLIGVDHTGARFADGSGLSRDDRVTARLLVDLDRAMHDSRHRVVWASLMAVMGESGTLERRLVGTPAQGSFYGKTGTLRDVTALSGTVVGDGVRRYHLAVIGNGAEGSVPWQVRVLQDELVLLLTDDLAA